MFINWEFFKQLCAPWCILDSLICLFVHPREQHLRKPQASASRLRLQHNEIWHQVSELFTILIFIQSLRNMTSSVSTFSILIFIQSLRYMTSGVSTFFHFDICPFFTCLHLSRIYTGGCYYFNKTTEEWEGVGLSVEEGLHKMFSSKDTKV